MADLSITVANVVPVAGYSYESAYLASEAITRGQTVALNASSQWIKADCDLSAIGAGSNAVGIALQDVAANQPIMVQTGGDLGLGAILTVGQVYCVSATAGGIAPYADLTTNGRVTILGVASTTSNLKLRIWASGIAKP